MNFKSHFDKSGKLPALKIEKRHVIAFKDKLIAEDLARGTITKQLGALAAVLQLAVHNDKLLLNPARGVRLPKGKLEKPYAVRSSNVAVAVLEEALEPSREVSRGRGFDTCPFINI